MNFREFFCLFEAQVDWGYTGDMTKILGSGTPGTLHYGTASGFPKPMLYVPLDPAVARSFREQAKKIKFDCVVSRHEVLSCKGKPVAEEVTPLEWVGEAHMTIAMGDELENALKNIATGLQSQVMDSKEVLKHISLEPYPVSTEKKEGLTYLFNDNNEGIPCSLSVAKDKEGNVEKSKIFRLVSPSIFKQKILACILLMDSPCFVPVRNALGLSPYPKLPPHLGNYKPHATIGYVNQEAIEEAGWVRVMPRGGLARRATKTFLAQRPAV